jgi:hypothetical protein
VTSTCRCVLSERPMSERPASAAAAVLRCRLELSVAHLRIVSCKSVHTASIAGSPSERASATSATSALPTSASRALSELSAVSASAAAAGVVWAANPASSACSSPSETVGSSCGVAGELGIGEGTDGPPGVVYPAMVVRLVGVKWVDAARRQRLALCGSTRSTVCADTRRHRVQPTAHPWPTHAPPQTAPSVQTEPSNPRSLLLPEPRPWNRNR